MGSKFNPWCPRLEVIQENESYGDRIPFEAQKSRKRLKRIGSFLHRGYRRSSKFEGKMETKKSPRIT
jgi:hypothetical protein